MRGNHKFDIWQNLLPRDDRLHFRCKAASDFGPLFTAGRFYFVVFLLTSISNKS